MATRFPFLISKTFMVLSTETENRPSADGGHRYRATEIRKQWGVGQTGLREVCIRGTAEGETAKLHNIYNKLLISILAHVSLNEILYNFGCIITYTRSRHRNARFQNTDTPRKLQGRKPNRKIALLRVWLH